MTEQAVDWHQSEKDIDPADLGVGLEGRVRILVGQTRDGKFWIAPLGTPSPTSYPPDDNWIFLTGAKAATLA